MADYGDTMFGSQAATDYYNQLQAVSSANNAYNAAQAEKQMKFQEQSAAKAMDFNSRQAEITRNWQEMMSNTAYQRQVKDMVSAGLNPVLGVSNSGAAVPSGATGTGIASQGAKSEADTTMANAFSSMVNALVQGQTARDVAEINAKTSMHNAEVSAEAVLASAGLSAGATKYASGLSAAAAQYAAKLGFDETLLSIAGQRERLQMSNDFSQYMAENYPTTWTQMIPALINALFGGSSDSSGLGLTTDARDALTKYLNDLVDDKTKNKSNKDPLSKIKYGASSSEYGKSDGRPKER